MSAPMPTKIRVGPYVYTVSQDVATLQAHEREKSGAFSGYADHSKMLIVVGPDEHVTAQRETVWHEVKHAVHHLYANSGDKVDDETHIRKMAPMELAVLRDNPDLVAYLLADVEQTITLPAQEWGPDRRPVVSNNGISGTYAISGTGNTDV